LSFFPFILLLFSIVAVLILFVSLCMYLCACVCVCACAREDGRSQTQRHNKEVPQTDLQVFLIIAIVLFCSAF
jgi:integral membrane sensor domain MASE1